MRKTIHLLCLTLAVMWSMQVWSAQADEVYNVVPRPHTIKIGSGKAFVLNEKTTIVCDQANEELLMTARVLAQCLEEQTGMKLAVAGKANKGNAIRLVIDGKLNVSPAPYSSCSLPSREGFVIKVSSNEVLLRGESGFGLANGMQMLRKALMNGDNKLPVATITDYPDMPFRGFMLDVGRNFYTLDEVKRSIDIAALHQLNVFHWHLTEDQGWRIEIKKYPKLTEVGAWRSGTLNEDWKTNDGIRHGGFYTQDEVREVVEYARQRHITVIPEIDMPGHMMAALAAYPELGCSKGPYEVQIRYGVLRDVLCVGGGKALEFCKDVLDEVLELFPSKYIHVGGDECPRVRWENCHACQTMIAEKGWTDGDDHKKEARLQSYFMQEIEKHLNKSGRRMIGWDEILEGGIAEDATIMSWTGTEGGIAAAKMHHDVVMTPIQVTYLSNRNRISKGLSWNLKNIYDFDPTASLTPEEANYIIGLQGCVWTEWIHSMRRTEYLTMPRLAAICERAWNRTAEGGLDGFLIRMDGLKPLYKKLDYEYWEE